MKVKCKLISLCIHKAFYQAVSYHRRPPEITNTPVCNQMTPPEVPCRLFETTGELRKLQKPLFVIK